MKQIPLPLIRLNQSTIVLLVATGIFLQQPLLIYITLVIQLLGLLTEGKANPVIALGKLLLGSRLKNAEKQAAELNRFNNSIAVILLGIATLLLNLEINLIGYIAAGFVAVAAFVAICGYCIGCTMYYQYKRILATRQSS
jgi:hypothetical protein